MADEIDVGSIVATIRIDADNVDSTLDRAVKGLNNFGESGKKAIDRAEDLQSQANGLAPILSKVGAESQSAADGISALNSKAKAGDLDKYDNQLKTLNADYAAQAKVVNELGAQIDDLVGDFYRLAERTGDGDAFDPSKIFPQESAQLDKEYAKLEEIEAKIKQVTEARKEAANAAVASAAKQASAAEGAAKAEGNVAVAMNRNTAANKQSNMVLDTGATALRAVTSAAGGTISKIGYLGTELMYLKRNMQAAAATGSMMASVISFGIMAAVTLVTTAISLLQEKEEKRQQAFEKGIENYEKYTSELQTLKQSLDVIKDSKSSTDQLTTARNNLASTFDNLIVGYTDEGEAILANNELIEKQIELTNKKISLARQEILANGNAIKTYNQQRQKVDYAKENYIDYIDSGQYERDRLLGKQQAEWIAKGGGPDAYQKRYIEAQQELIELYDDAEAEIKAYIQENINLIDSNTGVALSWEQLSSAQSTVGNTLILDYIDDIIDGNITYDEVLEKLRTKLSDTGYVDSFYKNLSEQTENSEAEIKKIEEAYADVNKTLGSALSTIHDVQTDLADAHAELVENGKLSQSTISGLIKSYPQLIDYLNTETGQLELTEDTMTSLYDIQKQLQIAELEAAKAKLEENEERIKSNIKVAQSELEVARASVMRTGYASDAQHYMQAESALKNAQQELDDMEKSYGRIDAMIDALNNSAFDPTATSGNKSAASGATEYSKALEQLNHQKRMGQLSTQEEIAALEELQRTYALTADEQMDWEYRMYTARTQYSEELEEARKKDLQDQYAQIEDLKALDSLTTEQELAWLKKIRQTRTLDADEQMELEKKIYSVQKQYEQEIEEARSKALQEQYTQMENLKALGELTSEQELEWLEKIRQTYELNAEERIALEIKMYNLKQELRQNEIDALDELGTAITEALKNQYDKQRQAEQERIEESIAAWDEWEKNTVASIQAEIDALDELAAEQESQAQAADYYQQSQELKLKIAYEKDDYQREQYQKELNRLQKEEQDRLLKEQTEAQKKELQKKMESVSDTADARRAALEAELDVINDNYDELTSALSLRAQAEKIIMEQSQEDIIKLITSYAPDYNISGQSIGESLYQGFKTQVDKIYDYVADVMSSIIEYQNNAISAASAAADSFEESYRSSQSESGSGATTINYTSNFNVPVESPVQTKRAIESTADSIAAAIRR